MASYYYQNLIKSVLEASTTDKWEIAVREWDIVDCQEDEKHLSEYVEKRIWDIYLQSEIEKQVSVYIR